MRNERQKQIIAQYGTREKAMHQKIFCWLTLAVSVIFASCAPAPVLRLNPLADETKWIYGKEFARNATDEAEIAVAFESMEDTTIVFDVEVTNLSAQPILVSPEKFHYLLLASPQDSVVLATAKQVCYALNPETKILDLDKEISRENASYATAAGIDATFELLDLIFSLGEIGKQKSEDEIKEEERQERQEEIADCEREINHEKLLAELKTTKEKWESTTLRRTTLDPDQSVRGRVYFRANQKAHYIKLCFPIGQASLQLIFYQQKIKA
jgi:hypothetical protein